MLPYVKQKKVKEQVTTLFKTCLTCKLSILKGPKQIILKLLIFDL